MPIERRSTMALLMAAAAFAMPSAALAAQDSAEAEDARYRFRVAMQRDAEAARAAGQRLPRIFRGNQNRLSLGNLSRWPNSSSARSTPYTERELAEIRAAQVRLVRDLTAGPQNPGGGVVLSHPRLGRIVIDNPGQTPGNPLGTLVRPDPGMIAGPSPIAGNPSQPEGGSGGGGSSKDPDPGSGGSGGSDEFPILEPGSGFGGPTTQPAPVGDASMRGYDAKAIARWDVVPYQDFDGLFHIGVVAFHINGIERVEFSVDGGRWTPVTEKKLNPRTDVWEYTATLDASLFDDGLVEVRARVFPRDAGEVRVLGGDFQRIGEHSLFLDARPLGIERQSVYVSAQGGDGGTGTSDDPVSSIRDAVSRLEDSGAANGGIIYLLPGEHDCQSFFTETTTTYLTISGAPDTDPSEVILRTDTGRPQATRLRLANLTGKDIDDSSFLSGSGRRMQHLWLDNVTLVGTDRHMRGPWLSSMNDTVVYTTRVIARARMEGLKHVYLARDTHVQHIQADSFGENPLLINCSVRDIFADGSGAHSDVYQWGPTQGYENVIVYGFQADEDVSAQGFFAGGYPDEPPLTDFAFVDVRMDNQPPWHPSSRTVFGFNRTIDHWVIDGVWLNGPTRWTDSNCNNVIVRDSWFSTERIRPADHPGVIYE